MWLGSQDFWPVERMPYLSPKILFRSKWKKKKRRRNRDIRIYKFAWKMAVWVTVVHLLFVII